MHWIIMPSGRALNLAHALSTSESTRQLRNGTEVPVTILHLNTVNEGIPEELVLYGPERDFVRRVLENLSTDGVWP